MTPRPKPLLRRPGDQANLSTLHLVREKERELTELIAAARREAEELVAQAQRKAESLVANAAADATHEAEAFLRHELTKVDREAQEIVARAAVEVEAVRRASAERLSEAVRFVRECVIPELAGKEGS